MMSSMAVTEGHFSTEAASARQEDAHNTSTPPPLPWIVAGPSTAALVIQTSLIPVVLLCNLLILLAIKKSKTLHKLSYYLMANVAVADGSVAISLAIRLLTQTSYDGRGCLASCAFLVLSYGASISGVLLLCVHNYRSAKYHKLLKNGFSDGAARGYVAGAWLLWTALACYGALTADVTSGVMSNVVHDFTPDVSHNASRNVSTNATHNASSAPSTGEQQTGTFFCHPIAPYYAPSYLCAIISLGLVECIAVLAVHAHTILILRQYQAYLHSRVRNCLPPHPPHPPHIPYPSHPPHSPHLPHPQHPPHPPHHPHSPHPPHPPHSPHSPLPPHPLHSPHPSHPHPHHHLVDMVKLMHVDRARRMGYVITLVICMMCCCCFSVFLLNAVLVLCPSSCGLSIEGIAPFSSLLLVNCINNVCIYALKSKEFRQSFRKLLRCRDNRTNPLHH